MMDISVSRLNQRMALQLPAEFPLGLVFVVGQVDRLVLSPEKGGRPGFVLVEDGYQLRCSLSERAAEESALVEGDAVRAGGHLAFDPHNAGYFLYVRDVEVLVDESPPGPPTQASLLPILEDIRRRSQATNLISADLPTWVRRIAPPEYRSNMNMPAEEERQPDLPETFPANPDLLAQMAGLAPAPADGQPALKMTDELVAFLSEAMDSPQDVELTPELMAELAPALSPEAGLSAPVVLASETLAAETRIPLVVVILVVLVLVIFFGALMVMTINLTGGG